MSARPLSDLETVPLELRQRDQWVTWRYVHRPGKAKPTKPPFDVRGGRASTTHPETWTPFEAARAASVGFDGIGFVFSAGDPYLGIDLDHAIDPLTGAQQPWATELLAACDSYAEVSPSGTGIHVLVRGTMPGGAGRKRGGLPSSPGQTLGAIEAYDRARYFTMTGRKLPGCPDEIRAPRVPLDQLLERWLPLSPACAGSRPDLPMPLSREDEALVEKARIAQDAGAFARLWAGDVSDVAGDESAADYRLCCRLVFWTDHDAPRVDRLFRASRLMRPKWDDRDNSKREVKRRLKAWGGGSADRERFKLLGRDEVPPLTNPAAWAQFPYHAYDLVIIDSLDATTEGVGEQDSGKPSKALAPILDIAHRANGPAILVLGNTVKSGAHSRGSGVVEDRADIAFEVRDATGFTPTGTRPWHEELPSGGVDGWAPRATRRKQRDSYRLAFVASKFRVGEEPEPFVYELRLPKDGPWSLYEVTAVLVAEGEAAAASAVKAHAAALRAEIQSRAARGDDPLTMGAAEALLMDVTDLKRKTAREVIREGTGSQWRIETLTDRQGQPKVLLPPAREPGDLNSAEITPSRESPVLTRSAEGDVLADRMNTGRRESPTQNAPPVAGISATGLFPPPSLTPVASPGGSPTAETGTTPEDAEVI